MFEAQRAQRAAHTRAGQTQHIPPSREASRPAALHIPAYAAQRQAGCAFQPSRAAAHARPAPRKHAHALPPTPGCCRGSKLTNRLG